jgi:hypothetical protein
MPFTPAHIAAALPLRRSKLVWSGLVVGTMAPDFEYFFRMSLNDRYGHTLTGTFFLTLPLALLTLWLFHTFVKLPLVSFLPAGVQRRLTPQLGEFRFGGAPRFALIVVSLLVGIATHLAWDSFTHSDTWAYRTWRVLREPVRVVFLGSRPIYRVLQHGSTVLGIGALLIWSVLWYRNTKASAAVPTSLIPPSANGLLLASLSVIAFAGGIVRAFAEVGVPGGSFGRRQFVGLFVVTAISLLWWQFVLYGFFADDAN